MRILKTKLYIPSARPGWVHRTRLLERLQAGRHRRLTLISAPAGSGKTTLVSSWLRSEDCPAVWLSLDERDNDPVSFMTYLLAGLEGAAGGVVHEAQRLFEMQTSHDLKALMIELVNDLSTLEQPLYLVLDDYHHIQELAMHDAMEFLVESLPPPIHLILVTRHDPPIALSRLRGRGEMTEIRQEDLRFTLSEAADMLYRTAGLRLSAEALAALGERTEGWATGLHLAALSMQGRDPAGIADFIREFSGRHHHVLDYITDEVLQRQPKWIQDFLLHTCILDRMCSELCNALMDDLGESEHLLGSGTESPDSRQVLAHLDRHNLFVVPLDDERTWYRYHHLFAELLRARLREAFPKRWPLLHERAATWYEANDFDSDAVKHALATTRPEFAAKVIERSVLDLTTWSKLEVATFRSWLAQLPADVVRARPWLLLFASRIQYVGGDWRSAMQLLEDLEESLKGDKIHPEAEQISRLVLADRASYAALRGDVAEAMNYASEALAKTEEADAIGQTRMRAILGMAYARSGRLSEAARTFSEAIETAHAAGMGFASTLFVCHLAEIQVTQGRLRQAMRTCEEARRLGTVNGVLSSHSGFVGLPEGRILYEWNRLEDAERSVLEGLQLLSKGQIPEYFGNMYALLGRVQWSRGKEEAANEACERAVQLALGSNIARLVSQARAEQARLWLAQGRVDLADRWADEYCLSPEPQYVRDLEDLTLARVRLAQNRVEEALDLLANVLTAAHATGRIATVIEGEVLRAICLQEQGSAEASLGAVGEALRLGEPEGHVRVFVDAGASMLELLRRAASGNLRSRYVGQLIAAFQGTQVYIGAYDANALIGNQSLVEPLTSRELEVLKLLSEGLTNLDIARRLVVSISTVKTHTRNIYGKLGINSRTEAVNQARVLGILPTP